VPDHTVLSCPECTHRQITFELRSKHIFMNGKQLGTDQSLSCECGRCGYAWLQEPPPLAPDEYGRTWRCAYCSAANHVEVINPVDGSMWFDGACSECGRIANSQVIFDSNGQILAHA
jgi:hypothetical protein